MRKNLAKHTAKKLPLAKRVLALCFALIFVCSCLLPAFANGTGAEFDTPDTEVVEAADPGTEPEPMDLYDEPAALDDSFGVADEPAAMDDDFGVDDEPAAMDDNFGVDDSFGMDDEPAAQDDDFGVDDDFAVADEPAAQGDEVEKPVEGGEPPVADDTPAEEQVPKTSTDASGNIVYEYDTSGTTFPDDDVAALPDGDQMQVDAAFSIPTNIYHFWLKKMSSYDLADIARDAKAAEMTVEQYLAMHGTDKGCYHIMTAADGANLKDYQFADPTSNDDPEGNSRTFAGWYYTDDLDEEQEFVFDEHLYVSEGTTVEVYAKWKDEAKPVTTTAELNALETAVTVDGLAGVDTVKVSQLDEYDEADLAEAIEDKIDMEKNVDLYAFDLTPVDKNGDTVQPDSGKKATVTIEGFDVTADDTVKVFHKADTGLEDLTSTASVDANGTLTFKTSSFSPFGVVVERTVDMESSEDEIALMSLPGNEDDEVDIKINLNAWITLDGAGATGTNHKWSSSNTNRVKIKSYKNNVAVISSTAYVGYAGIATVTHTYSLNGRQYTETVKVQVLDTFDKRGTGKTYDHIPATIFILKSPTGDPKATDIPSWGYGVLGATVNGGKILGYSTLTSASYVIDPQNNGYTLIQPRGWDVVQVQNSNGLMVDGWEMPRDTYGYDYNSRTGNVVKMYEQVLETYRGTLPDIPGVDKNSITADDITIYVVPYKLIQWEGNISAGNKWNIEGTELPALHIDSQIIVQCKYAYTANFYVKDVNEVDYTLISSKNYYRSEDCTTYSKVQNNNGCINNNGNFYNQYDQTRRTTYPKTKEDGGITYTLKYWYKDSFGNSIPWDGTDPYDPTVEELQKGVVNFYAEYVAETSSITLSKKVTGFFGDHTKEFSFKIDGDLGGSVEVVKDGKNYPRLNFTLKDGESVTVSNIPLNKVFTIVETCQDYDTTATGYSQKATPSADGERSFRYMLVSENGTVVLKAVDECGYAIDTVPDKAVEVVNERKGEIDNGVLLDTLPYILILVVVAGGGVLLFLRKRKNDDDE